MGCLEEMPGAKPGLLSLGARQAPARDAEGRRLAGWLHRAGRARRGRRHPLADRPGRPQGGPPAARAARRHPGGRRDGPGGRPALDRDREPGASAAPSLRVVLDGQLRTPRARLFANLAPVPRWSSAPTRSAPPDPPTPPRALVSAGAEVVLLEADPQGRIAPAACLALLAERQVQSVLLEGGSQLHAAFIAAAPGGQVAVFLAPQLLGGGIPLAAGDGSAWRPCSSVRCGPYKLGMIYSG